MCPHVSLPQCRASEFHMDDARNKWLISCPLWTSPTCLQTQSPHPHTNIHICTCQITNVLYTHTTPAHILEFYTELSHITLIALYIHLQKHNKCTFTSCKWGTFSCSSWPHISHTFTLHSLAPVPPYPHPSHTVQIYTVYASCLVAHCDAHTHAFMPVKTHTPLFTHRDTAGRFTAMKRSPLTL